MSWVVSLWGSVAFWEAVEYAAEALVFCGAAFEVLADFEYVLKGAENVPVRHRLARVAAITLVVGLALGLGALVRTNALFSDEINSAYRAAVDASGQATRASNDATDARRQARDAFVDAGKANERAAKNEKEAAHLNRVAEDERLARALAEDQMAKQLTILSIGQAQRGLDNKSFVRELTGKTKFKVVILYEDGIEPYMFAQQINRWLGSGAGDGAGWEILEVKPVPGNGITALGNAPTNPGPAVNSPPFSSFVPVRASSIEGSVALVSRRLPPPFDDSSALGALLQAFRHSVFFQ